MPLGSSYKRNLLAKSLLEGDFTVFAFLPRTTWNKIKTAKKREYSIDYIEVDEYLRLCCFLLRIVAPSYPSTASRVRPSVRASRTCQ